MSYSSPIKCKVTQWFLWRAILMLVMFGGFCIYFFYDWKVGYPEKNVVVANYVAFTKAGQDWTVEENRNRWEEYVAEQTIPFGDDASLYPDGTDMNEKWPSILGDKAAMRDKSDEGLWRDYSAEKGWPQAVDPSEDKKGAYKIKEQLYAAIVCLVLTLIALYYFLRTRNRAMIVDDEGYTAPTGKKIPFDQMVTIDKRKWETKGLAYITYTDENGEESKATVDGMVYGQFKEEDGAPAEALFQRILANFEGELIELVSVDEEDKDDEGNASAEEGSGSSADAFESAEESEDSKNPSEN